MLDYLDVLEGCIEEARDDEDAESLLRSIVQGVGKRAPVDALIEIGELLVDLRKRNARAELERN